MLSHLLHRAGVESVVVENRSRQYVQDRVRAGVLEQGTVDLMNATGVGERLGREGLIHRGLELRFGRHGDRRGYRIDLFALTGGKAITIYGQNKVVEDLTDARLAAGGRIVFAAEDVNVHGLDSRAPRFAFAATARPTRCNAISSPDATAFTAYAGRRSRPACSPSSNASTRSHGWGCSPRSSRPPRS
jgi:p-hydroxybenzoate 3-monooxygenase